MKQTVGKIAILSTAHREGTGAYVVLAEMLAAYPAKESLLVITPRDSMVGEACRKHRIKWSDLGTTHDSITQNLSQIRKILRNLDDVSVVHSWHARSLEQALVISYRMGIPVTATSHDHPESIGHGIMRRALIRFCMRRLTAVVYVSNAVQEAWRGSGMNTTSMVIHNGLADPAQEAVASAEMRPRIGFLGMYNSWKGFSTIADWIEKTSNESCEWHLFGKTDTSLIQKEKQIVSDHHTRVFSHGQTPREDIFSNIDILVHASTLFDPLPTVLIEAARAGIPCIASSLGGSAEVVSHGQTGYLFSPDNISSGLQRLRALISDPSLRKQLGKNAQEHYKLNFMADGMARGYASFWSTFT